MLSLPVPIFVAVILLFLSLRSWIVDNRASWLAALLALTGCQTLIIVLAQHYQISYMHLVQPITATIIPPVSWLSYQTNAIRTNQRSDFIHVLSPILALAAIIVAPTFLDVLIPGSFLFYGILILSHAVRGSDVQTLTLLSSGDIPPRIWITIGITLMASALIDLLIVITFASGTEYLKPLIISFYHVCILFVIGLLGLFAHLHASPDNDVSVDKDESLEFNDNLWQQIELFVFEKRPYLDPDLTLSKLSRRICIPARTLSSTINQATKNNVSCYINAARIAEAQKLILAGENITNAMLSSGFNTKSNFNREFRRITGTNPTQWLKDNLN